VDIECLELESRIILENLNKLAQMSGIEWHGGDVEMLEMAHVLYAVYDVSEGGLI
jgi:hypothetical protein